MQHRVDSFELEDQTKPGYRKLIALFLVDPHVKIISTAEVPPQQKAWWKEAVRTMASGEEGEGVLGLLPVELREQVLHAIDGFPISLEETKHQREKLVRERTNFVEWQDERFRDKNIFNVSLSMYPTSTNKSFFGWRERFQYHFEADAVWEKLCEH